MKVAEPADAWVGTWDATSYGPKCVNLCMITKKVVGEDDCLYLSVHTSLISKETCSPVTLMVHSSMYGSNTGYDELFPPDTFIELNQVFVSFNYRHSVTGKNIIPDVNYK